MEYKQKLDPANMKTKYNVDHFIKRFEAIPDEQWCEGTVLNSLGQRCAWGHLTPDGYTTNESNAFDSLLKKSGLNHQGDPSDINNGDDPRYQQDTPKQRILAALNDIKKKK